MMIDELPHTRPQTIKRFHALGIKTYWDLLLYPPFRFEDYRKMLTIATINEGDVGTIKGTVLDHKKIYPRGRITIQKVVISDGSSQIEATWFNQAYIHTVLPIGAEVSISGNIKRFGKTLGMEPKEYEVIRPDKPLLHTGSMVPVYPATYGLSSRVIREKVQRILHDHLEPAPVNEIEYLPKEVIDRARLPDLKSAILQVHMPSSIQEYTNARNRLGFNELLTIQLGSLIVKEQWQEEKTGFALTIDKTAIQRFIDQFPFELTGAQKRVTNVILEDLNRTTPMNRFVQGDVGSGKTAVAAIAAYATYLNGYQTLVMAPTEILAQQHYRTLVNLLGEHNIRVGMVTRTQKLNNDDSYDVVVGTHALLNQNLSFQTVGLVIIDEQHRFGVAQRAMLKEKGMNPHLLSMTATPIPRTVALTLYGELDMSIIDEMPQGRKPIKTSIVPETKRQKAYSWINHQIESQGIQAYIIFPLIEESNAETMKSVRAATKEFEHLQNTVFADKQIALLHGKIKPKEKDTIMSEFKEKKYDILISTSVVEVGIDVPNATIMIIEGAERFGLAQLHQLRGRVGRGEKQSYCFLFISDQANPFNKRLKHFSQTNSGIKLAEYDLEVRGAGELYGTKQSGQDLLHFADLTNLPLIESAKQAAIDLHNNYNLDDYPKLQDELKQYQVHRIAKD